MNEKQRALLDKAQEAGAEGIIVDGGRLRTAMALVRRGFLEWVDGSGGYRAVITLMGRMEVRGEDQVLDLQGQRGRKKR